MSNHNERTDMRKDNNINDFINEYYKKKLNIENLKEKNFILYSYIKTLQLNLLYYKNNKPPAWKWMYKYNYSPFIITLSNYLKNNKKINIYEFNENTPLKPEEQLLYILPKNDIKKILPLKYHKFININDEYYNNIDIELYNIYSKEKALIILKEIEIKDVILFCNNI